MICVVMWVILRSDEVKGVYFYHGARSAAEVMASTIDTVDFTLNNSCFMFKKLS